jgi:hypothetical protein
LALFLGLGVVPAACRGLVTAKRCCSSESLRENFLGRVVDLEHLGLDSGVLILRRQATPVLEETFLLVCIDKGCLLYSGSDDSGTNVSEVIELSLLQVLQLINCEFQADADHEDLGIPGKGHDFVVISTVKFPSLSQIRCWSCC